MATLRTIDIVSDGRPNSPGYSFVYLNFPNYTFTFGKSYLLDGWPWHGGDTLSWIIGGAIDQFSGKLLKNDVPYHIEDRRLEALCVGRSIRRGHRFSFR